MLLLLLSCLPYVAPTFNKDYPIATMGPDAPGCSDEPDCLEVLHIPVEYNESWGELVAQNCTPEEFAVTDNDGWVTIRTERRLSKSTTEVECSATWSERGRVRYTGTLNLREIEPDPSWYATPEQIEKVRQSMEEEAGTGSSQE